jgi:aspartyl-tRNA(Asn)/glutamyl-tRNA(Gln) amidotransferase subunit A
MNPSSKQKSAKPSGEDWTYLSLLEVAHLVRTRKVSPVDLLESILSRVEALNPKLNAFITVDPEVARKEAHRAHREIRQKNYRGLLHGIPLPIKDNIETRGMLTTAGSKILRDFIPDEDAEVVRALRRAGAVIFGKTNLHEFAYGITSENPHYGPIRNPWDTSRISGGSSGGSAVAVATGMGYGSLGTDTGGSIRIPASLCGTVGLKPTYGRVSTRGVIPLSKSLDHVGPLTRTVADAAAILEIISTGKRPFRSPFTTAGKASSKSRRLNIVLGWPREFFDRVEPEVQSAIQAAIKFLEKLGVRVQEISLGELALSAEAGTQIALAEARHYHESTGNYPAHADQYGSDVRERFEQASKVTAMDYLRATEARRRVLEDFDTAFATVDAIVSPATPIVAPKIGQQTVAIDGHEETVRSALVRISRPANFTGHPAIAFPCGFNSAALPIGLQLIGRHWDEAGIASIAAAYELHTTWHTMRPSV